MKQAKQVGFFFGGEERDKSWQLGEGKRDKESLLFGYLRLTVSGIRGREEESSFFLFSL